MIRIVRKSTLNTMKKYIKNLTNIIENKEKVVDILVGRLAEAREENKRLFDQHNKRLTKPKPDKNGVLRDNNGRFAKK